MNTQFKFELRLKCTHYINHVYDTGIDRLVCALKSDYYFKLKKANESNYWKQSNRRITLSPLTHHRQQSLIYTNTLKKLTKLFFGTKPSS